MTRAYRRAFTVFHWTLGIVVAIESVRTVFRALQGHPNHALLLLASVEAVGAALFLVPRTLRLGAGAMLATFAVAFLVHAPRGEANLALLVYAAGTVLVLLHHRALAAGSAAA
jgi:uncharacterized membrane protein YphA (DoxX/SURF4 family)